MGSPEVGGGDCDDVRRHLWSYLDRKTDPPTSAELEAHLEGCAYCRRMVGFDQSFKRLVRRCADAEPVSPSVVEALRVQVQRVRDARSVSPSVVGASKIDRLGSALRVFLALLRGWPRRDWARLGRHTLCFARWPALLVCCLIHQMRYSPALAERLIRRAVAVLPEPYRELYEAMWLGELDWLKMHGRPLIGWSLGVASTAVLTRLELRARLTGVAARMRDVPRSSVARAIGRYKPVWLGVLAAASVFCAAAVGWSGLGQHGPTAAQLVWAGLASVLAGSGMTWQAWPRGPIGKQPPAASGEPERTDAQR